MLSSAPGEAETAQLRPGWQWVGFGSVIVFSVWLPLAAVVQKLSPLWLSRLVAGAEDEADVVARVRALRGGALAWYYVLAVGPHVIALALASMAGGYVVGRWGKPEAGTRQAALAGTTTGLIASAMACASTGMSASLLVVVVIASLFAALGGRLARR